MILGIFVVLYCLQSITTASPVNVHTTEILGNGSSFGTRNVSGKTLEGDGRTFPNAFAESSITASSKPNEKFSEAEKMEPNMRKRDAEIEAESANGKLPIPFLFKRSYSLGSDGGGNEESRVFGNTKDYSDFPPFTGSLDEASHRQRRSNFLSDSVPDLRKQKEYEVNIGNERDRDAFVRLMTLLASKEYNPNLLNGVDDFSFEKADGNEGGFLDDQVSPVDLGYYGAEPLFRNKYEGSYSSKPISLMSTGDPTDLTRLGLHLSQVPGRHGLYLAQQQQQPISKFGMMVGGGNNLYGGNQEQRTWDNGDMDGWMDEAIPLQNHFKTRRSEGNSYFSYNPAKSHFRKFTRTPQLSNYYENGPSAAFEPYIRKRRSSFLKRSM